jgi:hypothetical protein
MCRILSVVGALTLVGSCGADVRGSYTLDQKASVGLRFISSRQGAPEDWLGRLLCGEVAKSDSHQVTPLINASIIETGVVAAELRVVDGLETWAFTLKMCLGGGVEHRARGSLRVLGDSVIVNVARIDERVTESRPELRWSWNRKTRAFEIPYGGGSMVLRQQ